MDWSLSKLIRIENGSVGISTNDLKVLLSHYGIVDGDRIEELIALARAAKERSWWRVYSGIASPKLLQFVEYEAAALITRNFEPILIPGLLQTEKYASEIFRKLGAQIPKDHADALNALRMKRQELLEQDGPPPWFFFIIDEAVVRRLVGGQDVMRDQIRHLIELADKDNVTMEIVPYSAGLSLGMERPFVVFEFSEAADEDVLYLESSAGDLINRDDQEEIYTYREIFEDLRRKSLGKEGTMDFLHELLDEMK